MGVKNIAIKNITRQDTWVSDTIFLLMYFSKYFYFGDESHVLKRKLHQNQGTWVTIYLKFVALFDIGCLFMKLILEIAHKLWIYCYCHIDAKEIYAKLILRFWATILDFDAFILNTTTYKICNIYLCILNKIYFSSF